MTRVKDNKLLKGREKIYREIVSSPKDLTTLKAFALKKKFVESNKKFNKVFEMLKSDGRIYVKAGKVVANPNAIKHGILVMKGKNRFVILEGDTKQYAINLEDSKGYFANQKVNVGFTDDGRIRKPFIISLSEKENKTNIEDVSSTGKAYVVGRVIKLSHDNLIFVTNDRRFSRPIKILNSKDTLSQYQDKICKMLISMEEEREFPACGIITEIMGDAGNPIHEYEAIAQSHGANMTWSDKAVLEEIQNIPKEVSLEGKTLVDEEGNILQKGGDKVFDLRSLGFATVDPATCKDMDDAIYSCFDKEGNLVVYTAVANVSKYVDLQSEIGKRYLNAGFTTYAPNRAYNILPPQLSTGICSLNPNVDRLALVVRTIIDEKTGVAKESTIMDAVIRSKEKYSYEEAQEILDKCDLSYEELKQKFKENGSFSKDEQVAFNGMVSKLLWKGFNKRHLIEFETRNEYNVIFNDDLSDIIDIEPQDDCFYHKVIEAFMLTANEATAKFANDHKIPNIYRVHESPNEDKIEQAHEFFGSLDIPFDGNLSPQGIRKIIDSVKGTSKEKMVNNFLVRLQSRAKYSNSLDPSSVEYVRNDKSHFVKNKEKSHSTHNKMMADTVDMMSEISHFGLQSKAYSHTTSPIRRISDFVTHKNILGFINGKKLINENEVSQIASWANVMQDEVKAAEREFNEVNSVLYCEKHIGEVMKGNICGFKKVGKEDFNGMDGINVLVENEEKGICVLIPAREFLPKGVKDVSLSRFGATLINKDNQKPVIRLCQDVTFKIESANRITRLITATTNIEREKDGDETLSKNLNEIMYDEVTISKPKSHNSKKYGWDSIRAEKRHSENKIRRDNKTGQNTGKKNNPNTSYNERKERNYMKSIENEIE